MPPKILVIWKILLLPIEPYVVSVLLSRAALNWLLEAGLTSDPDDLTRKVANNGVFHLLGLLPISGEVQTTGKYLSTNFESKFKS